MTQTLRSWFDAFTKATGETPETIVFAAHAYLDDDDWPVERNVLLPFDSLGDDLLDRKFDASWGGTEAPSFHAWTPSWVLVPGTYDGSEWLEWIPRTPTADSAPHHIGGG